MSLSITALLSKYFFYPIWDVWDRSFKLTEWKRLERNQWERLEKKQRRQERRLMAMVNYAIRHCDYYKNLDISPIHSMQEFRRIPLLSKSRIRSYPNNFISDQFKKSSLGHAKTGGSTSTALDVYFDKRCEERRNAAALRSDRWAGWDFGQPLGALWGNPPVMTTFKEKVRNIFLERMTYLDTVLLNESSMTAFLEETKRKKIKILMGHAHSLYILAGFVQKKFKGQYKFDGVISTSMMLLPSEREVIEDGFQCRVTNRYGCEEVGLIACECEKQEGLHINIDHVFVEFLREDGSPAQPGEDAQLVVTDLLNKGMPLIRYQVGDVGVFSDEPCSCGRSLPLLKKIVGRTADFLVHEDGSLVAGVSLVERTLTAIPGIDQMQIIQDATDHLDILVVPSDRYTEASQAKLESEMKAAMGANMKIEIHAESALKREKNGKYRFAICKVRSAYRPEVTHA